MKKDKKRSNDVIDENGRIKTTYPVRKIPYVPSAVRDMPFTIHPVKK